MQQAQHSKWAAFVSGAQPQTVQYCMLHNNAVNEWKTNVFNSSSSLCRPVLVQFTYRSVNWWNLLSADHSIMYICATAVRCSCSYVLPSKRDSKGVCGCHRSVCVGLRSISPAGLFHHQPKLQMEGRLYTSKAQFCFLIKYARYRVRLKLKDTLQKLNDCESIFPLLCTHNPNKAKRTGKDMSLVGCSGRKKKPLPSIR